MSGSAIVVLMLVGLLVGALVTTLTTDLDAREAASARAYEVERNHVYAAIEAYEAALAEVERQEERRRQRVPAWCHGCDGVVVTRQMAWTDDGRYVCPTCRVDNAYKSRVTSSLSARPSR